MHAAFIQSLALAHQQAPVPLPGAAFCDLADQLLALLFPERAERPLMNADAVAGTLSQLRDDFVDLLASVALPRPAPQVVASFLEQLPVLRHQLTQDAAAIAAADPAAQGHVEVVSTYPGFYAVALHRLAHAFYRLGVAQFPRLLSEHAHARTGIDIHPGARIGPSFSIDHGTGLVIGETTVIGAYVRIFQGVTLGALSVAKHLRGIKRHPTIEDHVVIYAGATILGGSTVIGRHSIIGGNVWLTESVPSHSRVYHKAQIHVTRAEDPLADLTFSI